MRLSHLLLSLLGLSGKAIADDLSTVFERRLPFIVSALVNTSAIPSWLSTLSSDGSWPDIDYSSGCAAARTTWPAQSHWQRIAGLAAAFSGVLPTGNMTYLASDPELLDAISDAMNWWFERDFTDSACIDQGGTSTCPCGTPGLWDTNWFSNVILIPHLVGDACLLIQDYLSPIQFGACVSITARSFGRFAARASYLTGANILDVANIGIASALLQNDSGLMDSAFARVNAQIAVQARVDIDGIKPDGSFQQHNGTLYNGNYGQVFISDVLELVSEAASTQWESSSASKAAFVGLVDGSSWMVYQNTVNDLLQWDLSSAGRFITFPTADEYMSTPTENGIEINFNQVGALGNTWGEPTLNNVARKVQNSTGTANVGPIIGNRMFWSSDYMVHRGNNYVTTVKMFSTRTRNSECLNSANPFGFHLSDFTTYTYMDGNEYAETPVVWDWNLIPGITIDYGATTLTCATVRHYGLQAFVGGVSYGTLGVAAMKYTNPVTRKFSFQKAILFFDNDVQHVLVTGISSKSSAAVYSVLDQRRHAGDIFVNNKLVKTSTTFSNPSTLWHGNVAYVFDSNPTNDLILHFGAETGDWPRIGTSASPPETIDMFSARLHHKVISKSASEYTIFPAIPRSQIAAKISSIELVSLANDPNKSGVWDAKKLVLLAVFWMSQQKVVVPAFSGFGTLTVSADHPLILVGRLDTWNLALSDPTQTLHSAKITLTFSSTKKLPKGWGGQKTKVVTVNFPTGGNAGSTVVKAVL